MSFLIWSQTMSLFIIILVVLAIVFALLELFTVPSRVSWSALGVLCLAVAIVVPLVR